MNTPFLWIFLPGLLAAVLFAARAKERLVRVAGTAVPALLALLAWKAPVGEPIILGPLSVELADSLTILGRRLVLETNDRSILVLIYLALAFWFLGAGVARAGKMFIPLGMAITSLLTAALAVEPFLYAGLLIEIAVLISIPLIVPPGKTAGRGVLRYLTFQTLGMPFLLFTGWLLQGVEPGATAPGLIANGAVLMGLGFTFLLAVFPFHTWVQMLAQEAHPYVVGFIFYFLPLSVSLFALDFLEQFAWLRTAPAVFVYLRLAGVLMVFASGLWAAVQRHLGRMFGFAVSFEIGMSLLAISLGLGVIEGAPEGAPGGAPGGAPEGTSLLGIFFAMLLPRGLGLAVWALSLAKLRERYPDLHFRSVQGAARSMPLAAAGLVLAHLSLVGFPLLAGFPVRLALWNALADQFPPALMASLLGSAGLLVGGLRQLAVLLMGSSASGWQISEGVSVGALLAAGILLLFLVGMLPQFFLPAFTGLMQAFAALGQ